jgi:single-stranded DNA-binding protein
MATYQSFTIIGHLGRDPRTGTTKNDKEYTAFSVAVDPAFGDGALWVNVMAYNRFA